MTIISTAARSLSLLPLGVGCYHWSKYQYEEQNLSFWDHSQNLSERSFENSSRNLVTKEMSDKSS